MSKINKNNFSYEIFCVHRQQLTNQGVWWCDLRLDVNCCDESCPGRHPKIVNSIITSISTD